jgi:hypothetical protein
LHKHFFNFLPANAGSKPSPFICRASSKKREANENFTSTGCADHALNHADAAEAIRHSAFRVLAAMHGPDRWQTRIASSHEFVDPTVNRKVDGTFTDLIQ